MLSVRNVKQDTLQVRNMIKPQQRLPVCVIQYGYGSRSWLGSGDAALHFHV